MADKAPPPLGKYVVLVLSATNSWGTQCGHWADDGETRAYRSRDEAEEAAKEAAREDYSDNDSVIVIAEITDRYVNNPSFVPFSS